MLYGHLQLGQNFFLASQTYLTMYPWRQTQIYFLQELEFTILVCGLVKYKKYHIKRLSTMLFRKSLKMLFFILVFLLDFFLVLLRADHPNYIKRGGVCIYFKESLSLIRQNGLTNIKDCLVTEISVNNEQCSFTCVYR